MHLFAKKMQDLVTQMRTFKTEVKSEMKNVEACEKEEIGDVVTGEKNSFLPPEW